MNIEITKDELNNLIKIKDYLKINDKHTFEHFSFSVLNSLVKKLSQHDVSVCACGSTKYYSEQYKDVTKYFCSNCHEKLQSKN